jgi:hypothetical protein
MSASREQPELVLVGMGEVRVRVPVQEFGSDLAKAARTPNEQDRAMEEVKNYQYQTTVTPLNT